MGLFHRDIGSKAQVVKLHHRRLRHSPIPNTIRFAHWAIQVGDYFYELAAPPKDFVALKLHDDLIREPEGQAEDNENDSDIDDNIGSDVDDNIGSDADGNVGLDVDDNVDSEDDYTTDSDVGDNTDTIDPSLEAEGDFHFSDENNYKSNTTIVHIVEGRKVPLRISKGSDWRRLNIKSRLIGFTYLKSEKIIERADHIFRSVFKQRYDFLYYNCHAFACYLCFSIALLDKSTGGFPVARQPSDGEKDWVASIAIYSLWFDFMNSTARRPIRAQERNHRSPGQTWSVKEKKIDYSQIIPPQKMHEILNPRDAMPVKSQRQMPHQMPHVEPKSHAAHLNHQHHHDIQNILNQVIVATTTQQAAAQASSSQAINNAVSNPIAFGMTPGMGFGF